MHSQKAKLALLIPSLRGGGVERVMLNLAIGFAEKGFLIDLIVVKAEGPFLEQVPNQVRIVDLNASGSLASLPKLVKYLRMEKPYALLAAMDHVNIVALTARILARSKTKILVSIHNTLSHASSHTLSIKGRVIPRLSRHLYQKADKVIAVSQGVAQDFNQLNHFPLNRIEVIYNPVVSSTLFEQASVPAVHPWIVDESVPVILAVGRLTAQKDFETLIRAFAVARGRVEAKLLILGEGEERLRLQELITSLNVQEDVSLAGFADNPYPYMANTDVFVLSSRWEGLPTVLIEALALGANIVSTDCESGPREILLDGEYGRLVPVGKIEDLSEAIVLALKSPIETVRGQGVWRFERGNILSSYLEAMSL